MAMEPKKEGLAPVGGEIRMSAPEERLIIESPEQAEEQVAEMKGEAVEPTAPEMAPVEPAAVSAVQAEEPEVKDWKVAEIEGLLSEDLGDLYKQMPSAKRAAFKARGEKLAVEFAQTLPKAKPEQVFKQVKGWLKMIPATNPYYLEQEAKIKTDRLFLLS